MEDRNLSPQNWPYNNSPYRAPSHQVVSELTRLQIGGDEPFNELRGFSKEIEKQSRREADF